MILDLQGSALSPGVSPVHIHYREAGAGRPLVILHGGWGYEIYPFDRQIAALATGHRIVIPDRTGYGGSARLDRQATDFHHCAAAETFAVIEALGLERPVVWGHSDGAVIALLMGRAAPERLSGVVAEATHYYRNKPASRDFLIGSKCITCDSVVHLRYAYRPSPLPDHRDACGGAGDRCGSQAVARRTALQAAPAAGQ